MVTRGIIHHATETLPVIVIQSVFLLLPLSRYLLPLPTLNRYQPADSSGKCVYYQIENIFGNHTALGFGHD